MPFVCKSSQNVGMLLPALFTFKFSNFLMPVILKIKIVK